MNAQGTTSKNHVFFYQDKTVCSYVTEDQAKGLLNIRLSVQNQLLIYDFKLKNGWLSNLFLKAILHIMYY